MVNIGDSFRLGWDGKDSASTHVATLSMAAGQRSVELSSPQQSQDEYASYVPAQPDDKTPYDLKEASEYYLTPRAQHPHAENKMLIRSFPLILTFDAFTFVDMYLVQPVCCVVGEKAGSKWHTDRLDELLKKVGPHAGKGVDRIVVVEEGTHMDFYDCEKYVSKAVEEVGAFMREKLL
ncbi:hypothetical protein ABW20_dc0106266 [Dactylellina cionopaga]|nr:hypothetical protein ABW20_dc0106266 [Dactylellina cionopaga]